MVVVGTIWGCNEATWGWLQGWVDAYHARANKVRIRFHDPRIRVVTALPSALALLGFALLWVLLVCGDA